MFKFYWSVLRDGRETEQFCSSKIIHSIYNILYLSLKFRLATPGIVNICGHVL